MSTTQIQGAQGVPACHPDLAAAYVAALTGNVDTEMDWRCLSDTDAGLPGHVNRGTLSDVWPWITGMNEAGYGCFVNASEMDGHGLELTNVTAVRAHVVDLDGIDADQQRAAAAEWSPAPSFQVETSPGRFHVYWVLSERYADNDRFTALQRRIRQKWNGDKAVVDPTRILRLPGTLNRKRAEPHLVRCEALAGYGQPLTVDQLEASLSHLVVQDGGNGERHDLGDLSLAAPSLELVGKAMAAIDPNTLDRDEWIKALAALKQSVWTHLPPDAVTTILLHWCSRYEADDPAEDRKQIASIRSTSAGWPSILKMVPQLRAEASFGASGPAPLPAVTAKPATGKVVTYDLPVGTATTGAPSHLDVVRQCEDWRLPIAHDTFADRLMVAGTMPGERPERGGKYPRPLSDRDYTIVRLQFNGLGLKPGSEAVRDGVNFYATTNPYNPVTDWLDTLRWDGVPRIDHWLARYVGVEPGPWATIAGSKFLIAMVARAMKPGCKVDTVLTIDGRQGAGKSTALCVLAGEDQFGDQLPNVRDKEGLHYMQGLWMIEIAELAAIRKAELEDVRKFITARIDRYRPPYGHQLVDRPRQCVFAATTNETTYLRDHAGDRRFWPVTAGSIDLDALAADRDQLFAEAVHRYLAGEAWHLTPAEEAIARVEQAKRRKVSEWFASVASVCADAEAQDKPEDRRVTMREVFLEANLSIGELGNPRYTSQIAGDLAALGWRQDRTTAARFYVKDDTL